MVILLYITSCEDCYYIEHDLHGMWQVESVERFSTGEVTKSHGELYYSFQRSLVKLGYKHLNIPESMLNYIAYFDFITKDSIGMGYFRKSSTGEGDEINNENRIPVESLHKFGMYQDYSIFHMQKSKKELILISDSSCVILNRY